MQNFSVCILHSIKGHVNPKNIHFLFTYMLKVIDRPTQTPLCGFTFATQKPLIKASL